MAAMGDVRGIGRPKEVGLLMAIRCAKSMIAAATAIHASQHCDVSRLGPGEIPRVSVVSLNKDLANVVRDHVVGQCTSKALSQLIIGTPTAAGLFLRHPSGIPVEIRVVAGAKAGASLAARWSAGAIFDEAPKMVGADDGVVNLDDARANVIGRLLPGAQIIWLGSPWAPFGPVYELTQEHHLHPTSRLVIVRAKGPQLNPMLWTPEACAALQRTDPDAYMTDVEAQFLAPESNLFTEDELKDHTRKDSPELPYDSQQSYCAGMDPATRGNAWALVIMTMRGGKRQVAFTKQWVGSRAVPLSARETLQEMAGHLRRYRVTDVESDAWSGDAIREIAAEYGLYVRPRMWTNAENTKHALRFRSDLLEGLVELAPVPEMTADLQRVVKRTTQTGVSIEPAKTADGRHGDYWPALLKAFAAYVPDRRPAPKTAEERAMEEEQRLEAAAMERLEQQQGTRRRSLPR